MNVVLTGATGFLGRAVLQRLVADGHAVRALVRREAARPPLLEIGADARLVDLSRAHLPSGLFATGDTIIHAAAHVELAGPWSAFKNNTIATTRRLLEAALPARPRRFVYISSAGVYAPQPTGSVIRAATSAARPNSWNHYGRAKLAAENLVRAACSQAGCPFTILRLGFLYGPGNLALFDRYRPLFERRWACVIRPGDNHIATLYIDDAAAAISRAAELESSESFVLDVASEERVTQRQFIHAVSDVLGLPRTRRFKRRRVVFAAATIADWARRLAGIDLGISRTMIALMTADQRIDCEPTRTLLTWSPSVNFDEGIARTAEWFAAELSSQSDTARAGPRRAERAPA